MAPPCPELVFGYRRQADDVSRPCHVSPLPSDQRARHVEHTGASPGPRDRVGFFSPRSPDTLARGPRSGRPQAHPPNGNRSRVCCRARRCASFGRPGSVLSALFAVSTVLAVLCGGCSRRRRRDDRNRAILGAHGNAALLLWLLWTALFPSSGLQRAGILPAGGASSLAGRQLHASTDLQAIRRQHRQTIEPTGAEPLAGGAYQSTAAALLKDVATLAAYKQNGKSPCRSRELKSAAPLRAAA